MTRIVPLLSNALETITAILNEPLVTDMRGEAYTDDEPERIKAGLEALQMLDPDPQGYIARYQNEKLLGQAGKAVDLADRMLERQGFIEAKNRAWTDHDQQVIREGLEACRQAFMHARN